MPRAADERAAGPRQRQRSTTAIAVDTVGTQQTARDKMPHEQSNRRPRTAHMRAKARSRHVRVLYTEIEHRTFERCQPVIELEASVAGGARVMRRLQGIVCCSLHIHPNRRQAP